MKQTRCANEIAITAESFSVTARERGLPDENCIERRVPISFSPRILFILSRSRCFALPFLTAEFDATNVQTKENVRRKGNVVVSIAANNPLSVDRLHRIRRGYEFTNIKANEVPRVIVRRECQRALAERGRPASSNFANEGIEIAPAWARSQTRARLFRGPEGPVCKRRASRRNRARSLVGRKTDPAHARPHPRAFSNSREQRQRETWRRRMHACNHPRSSRAEPARAERSYHSHICKPTGRTAWKLQARDALPLVSFVGHGPRGDGKIAGTKHAWAPSRGEEKGEIGRNAAVSGYRCERASVFLGRAKRRVESAWNGTTLQLPSTDQLSLGLLACPLIS